jgi:ubiquitin-like 1-activating enzyme E1 B
MWLLKSILITHRHDHPADGPNLLLPSPLPIPPRKEKPVATTEATPPPQVGTKRSAPDDDEIALVDGPSEPASKRVKTAPTPTTPKRSSAAMDEDKTLVSPSKRRRLDEDGLIMLDGPGEKIEDDEIIIVE